MVHPLHGRLTVISIHAPRVGSDNFSSSHSSMFQNFNPRSPCGERPDRRLPAPGTGDFNPRSPCGERRLADQAITDAYSISIHAPRVGSDGRDGREGAWHQEDFNPRSPCGERLRQRDTCRSGEHFNPRSPCGERRVPCEHGIVSYIISIHAPRVGSDRIRDFTFRDSEGFQSTLPVWGATLVPLDLPFFFRHFNPRSPCGERPGRPKRRESSARFQSTLPVWGATCGGWPPCRRRTDFNPRSPCGERLVGRAAGTSQHAISIHAPRVGSDCGGVGTVLLRENFNPRSPCGERPMASACLFMMALISIHAPRVGSDLNSCAPWVDFPNFNPRSPCGERRPKRPRPPAPRYFNPRSPCGERRPPIRN